MEALMTRLVLAFFGVSFLGSFGAFFLFVPLLWIATVWIATVALLLMGLLLMFCLGVQVELQPVLPLDVVDRKL
jgi:hypothetical protein